NADENQNVLYMATATDSVDFTDGVINWSLTGADAALLDIDTNGVVTLKTGNLDYESGKINYSFNVMVAGASSNQSTQAVTVSITDPNDPPVAADDTGSVNEDATLTVNAASGVLANDNDINGNTLTVSEVNGNAGGVGAAVTGTYGTLTLNANGSYTYV